jgi:uncharacterized protein
MSAFDYDSVKDLLCCPKTRAELVFTGEALVSCDADCRLMYPIVDGFPVLLVDEATALTPAEWGGVMARHGRDPVTGRTGSSVAPKG